MANPTDGFKGRVLIADVPEGMEVLAQCFPAAEKVCVTTMDEARKVLAEAHYDLVVIGFHFNGARIFDLLGHVRKHCHGIPVICVRLRPLPLPDEIRESIRNAVLVMGGTAFIDVSHVTPETFCGELERRGVEL